MVPGAAKPAPAPGPWSRVSRLRGMLSDQRGRALPGRFAKGVVMTWWTTGVLRRLGGWAACLALGLAPAAWAQPGAVEGAGTAPDGPQVRSAIQAALADYEAGRLAAAERQFRALARQGHALGRYNLAMMHMLDEVEKPDRQEAVMLLEQSAEQGFIRAEYALGQVYELGLAGPPDMVRAVQWYRRAAGHGHLDAQVAMGTAHYLGRGAPKDMAEAAHWYRLAATGGDIGAQYLIASMYEQGLGVAADLRLARYWYEIAAGNGDEIAPWKVKEIDRRLGEPAR